MTPAPSIPPRQAALILDLGKAEYSSSEWNDNGSKYNRIEHKIAKKVSKFDDLTFNFLAEPKFQLLYAQNG